MVGTQVARLRNVVRCDSEPWAHQPIRFDPLRSQDGTIALVLGAVLWTWAVCLLWISWTLRLMLWAVARVDDERTTRLSADVHLSRWDEDA